MFLIDFQATLNFNNLKLKFEGAWKKKLKNQIYYVFDLIVHIWLHIFQKMIIYSSALDFKNKGKFGYPDKCID